MLFSAGVTVTVIAKKKNKNKLKVMDDYRTISEKLKGGWVIERLLPNGKRYYMNPSSFCDIEADQKGFKGEAVWFEYPPLITYLKEEDRSRIKGKFGHLQRFLVDVNDYKGGIKNIATKQEFEKEFKN